MKKQLRFSRWRPTQIHHRHYRGFLLEVQVNHWGSKKGHIYRKGFNQFFAFFHNSRWQRGFQWQDVESMFSELETRVDKFLGRPKWKGYAVHNSTILSRSIKSE